ncbi:universal stress protein [Hyphobacterium sp.]|uniref:universal stress protein n=1 Tax=Hyphobacterium sp. TaxID=2004662 RepID=UPI003BAC80E1
MAKERIVVTLQGDDIDILPSRAAARLAARFDATLDAIFLEPDPTDFMMWAGPSGAAVSVMAGALSSIQQESDKRVEQAKMTFIDALEYADLTAIRGRFLRISDQPEDAAAETRLSRLVVTSRYAASGNGPVSALATAILIDEQTPIYVCGEKDTPPAKVAIAWDGSREAARAMYAAAPLISAAEKVTVLQSEKGLEYRDRRAASVDRLYDWLSVRGKRSETVDIDAFGPDVGECLLQGAQDHDLLVAGAYGHSRLREFVFGGVTRTLLAATDGPAMLLAH